MSSSEPELAGSVAAADVGRLVRRGATWSILLVAGRNLLNIGSTAVLARLLSPDNYGLIGMVSTLTALLLVFSDMGLSWATVQRKELTHAQVSNLFWINGLAGLILWLVCLALAPYLSAFYGRSELTSITIVNGAGFLLSGLAVQPLALLSRRMEFRRIAIIELLAQAFSIVASILSALLGWGYWSLVVLSVSGHAARFLLGLRASGLALQLPVRGVGTRGLARFGSMMALNGLLIYFARNLDNVFVGKVWGSETLGYYGRAYFLMLLPSTLSTGALARLMVPALSALQDDQERLGQAYRKAIRLVAYVGCPMAAGLALTAGEAVRLVYGVAWMPVVPLLTWLSIAGITQPIYNTTGWLFTSTGRAGAYFRLTLVNAVTLAAAFYLAAPYGAQAVAGAYGITMGGVLLLPSLHVAHQAAGIRFSATLGELWPVLLSVAAMALAVALAGVVCSSLSAHYLTTLLTKVLVGVGTYLLASRLFLGQMLVDDLLPLLPGSLVPPIRHLLRLSDSKAAREPA